MRDIDYIADRCPSRIKKRVGRMTIDAGVAVLTFGPEDRFDLGVEVRPVELQCILLLESLCSGRGVPASSPSSGRMISLRNLGGIRRIVDVLGNLLDRLAALAGQFIDGCEGYFADQQRRLCRVFPGLAVSGFKQRRQGTRKAFRTRSEEYNLLNIIPNPAVDQRRGL